MSSIELPPYFHPTQMVLVDDDIDFLGNLSLQLDAEFAYLLFDSTTKALGYINDRRNPAGSRRRFFRIPGDDEVRGTRVQLDTDALLREMHYSDRFSQISIAMVDYAMPRMNGLEFCERIADPHIKKILFTGVATETEAIDAFNRGVIDRYIRKSEHHVYDHLNRTIRELQYAYVRDVFAAAGQLFDALTPDLLADPDVIALMEDLRKRYAIVEYYLTADPPGFVLVDGDGRLRRLVLQDAADRAAQVERARAAHAPPACVAALERGQVLLDPFVMPGPDSPSGEGDPYRDWQRIARAASPLRGPRDPVWAVFEVPAGQSKRVAPAMTYHGYLEWLDTVGYSLM